MGSVVPHRSYRRNSSHGRRGRPAPLHSTSQHGGQDHRQIPAITITLQTSPPRPFLQFQFNGFLSHQLVRQGRVVTNQLVEELTQLSPFGLCEFEGPALPSDQNAEFSFSRVPGYAPAGPLLLDHSRSTSTWQQIGLVLLITQFHDGSLHRFDAGLLQEAIEIIKTTLFSPKGNPDGCEISIAGLANQAFTALGQLPGIDPR